MPPKRTGLGDENRPKPRGAETPPLLSLLTPTNSTRASTPKGTGAPMHREAERERAYRHLREAMSFVRDPELSDQTWCQHLMLASKCWASQASEAAAKLKEKPKAIGYAWRAKKYVEKAERAGQMAARMVRERKAKI